MSRTVIVHVKTKLVIRMDEGVEVNEVIENMDYDFTTNGTGWLEDNADIEDTEILEHTVIDSK